MKQEYSHWESIEKLKDHVEALRDINKRLMELCHDPLGDLDEISLVIENMKEELEEDPK